MKLLNPICPPYVAEPTWYYLALVHFWSSRFNIFIYLLNLLKQLNRKTSPEKVDLLVFKSDIIPKKKWLGNIIDIKSKFQ